MHIPADAEGTLYLANRASLTSCPFRKSLFLAVGMLVPATDRRGLGTAKERRPVYDEDAERLKAERKAQRRARYRANREQILARAKAFRAANPEKQRAYAETYREAHKEQRKATNKAYHAANREKRLAYMVAYRAARRATKKSPQ